MGIGLPFYKPLTAKEVKKIDQTARRILEYVGIRIHGDTFLDKLRKAGAQVDYNNQRIRFAGDWLDELLSYAVKLEYDYIKLLRSRTWKVMAPVREVGRTVKSLLRGKRVPRNRLPKRPSALADEPIGGRHGNRI